MENSSKENTQLFSKNTILPIDRSSSRSESSASKEKGTICGGMKIFLAALSFVYFAKALSGSYLKSTITQIEKRFDIPSSLVGLIDGSFEIGNLLIIILVSYFGAKLHRPKIIGAGCLIMSFGTFLIAMPQFFMGHYRYEIFSSSSNSTVSISPCLQDQNQLPVSVLERAQAQIHAGCEKEAGISMWIYVLLGNLLRGIGETPIQPLGIAYIDDHATEESAAFYIGCVQTVAIIGPIFGFLLGSLCATLYVDIGFVDMDSISITHKDSQWVGAWWLGYLIAGVVSILAAIPFWFLPKHLPRPDTRKDSSTSSEQSKFINEDNREHRITYQEQVKFLEMARDFLPSLKSLFGNPVYFLYLCSSITQFNSLIGMVTYKAKYIEQQFGQSSSKTNFVIGLINIPAVALGIFSGGLIMKKFRLNVLGAAKLSLGSSFFGYLLLLLLFAIGCKNVDVAGLTVSYKGYVQLAWGWAGEWLCQAGAKRPAVLPLHHISEVLCFMYFRCINPHLKSFALGIYTLAIRVLAGIPAPVYFGVSIDTTCLRWGSKRCGGQGACRLYDSNAFRYIYLGLTVVLGTMSTFLSVAVLIILKKRYSPHNETIPAIGERESSSVKSRKSDFVNSDHVIQTTYWPEKETRL
uniref:Solute carrier organic anion transporter family member n=1 Tax=Podarcis muralis TaxID=64176 RepID=A0A670KL12_PODMU